MKHRFLSCAVVVAVWLVSNAAGFAGEKAPATRPSQESDAERSAGHLRIAERREGTMVMVHRGASAFAPENSLAAYAAAMDYGADDIARQFDDADAWDHVVSINTYNTARLRTQPKLKLLAHKGPGLSEFRRDMDPDAVQAQLARPGEMIMVDNPRVAVRALKRDPYQPMPLPRIAAFDEKLTQYKQRVPALFRFNALLTSVPSQRLVTDCEVCCRPFQVHAECEPGEILSLEVASS